MPVIYEPFKPHECDLPTERDIELLEYQLGTLWLCDDCGKVHELRRSEGHTFWYPMSIRASKKLVDKYCQGKVE